MSESIENLISSLHERFGDDFTSPQQQQLMDSLKNYTYYSGEEIPVGSDFKETLDLLLKDIEWQHPQAAGVIREVMEILKNMGI
ncbi:hypothetical protein AB835_05645 [Candidatus Endobugula sertula]|uniref:DUF4404 domain-containing protein n=1 Tax=Candidatus Endobugula sertula TaxID=62101 RepID=A0A1D2QQY2_9GAMM|nr:hypothetical protein AB835_05645 [Candidatus Endobugula sertula]